MSRCAVCLILLFAASLAAAESATFSEARAAGVEEAQRDIAAGSVALLSYGMPMDPVNLDRASGLPTRAIAGCIVDDGILGRAQGYNDTVRAHLASHGQVPGNHLAWIERILEPAAHLDPQPVVVGTEAIRSPDDIWALSVGEDGLRVVAEAGVEAGAEGAGFLVSQVVPEVRIELHWGPVGSDLVTVVAVAPNAARSLRVVDLRRGLTLNQVSIRPD
jgi:hypothetical protein